MIVIDTDVLIWLLRGNEKVKEMFKKAIKLGYKNFKISGRENTIKDIENDIRRILYFNI